jgi:hypothetical protein
LFLMASLGFGTNAGLNVCKARSRIAAAMLGNGS